MCVGLCLHAMCVCVCVCVRVQCVQCVTVCVSVASVCSQDYYGLTASGWSQALLRNLKGTRYTGRETLCHPVETLERVMAETCPFPDLSHTHTHTHTHAWGQHVFSDCVQCVFPSPVRLTVISSLRCQSVRRRAR